MKKIALWIGCNPSTADAEYNDPTIIREINFTKMFGCNCYIKMNVLDYRATNPKNLPIDNARSKYNFDNICNEVEQLEDDDLVIFAHGNPPSKDHVLDFKRIYLYVREIHPDIISCLGTTKAGWAKHSLYLRKDTKLIPYEMHR